MWSQWILDQLDPDYFGEKDRALWIESLKKRWGLVGYTDRELYLEQKDPINSQQKE